MTAQQLYHRDIAADLPSVQRFISRIPMNYRGTANWVKPIPFERLPEKVRRAYERRANSSHGNAGRVLDGETVVE